jgi:dihydroorotase
MITIKNLLSLEGSPEELNLASDENIEIDGSGLIALPALIDPHVHFRIPGNSEKEDWRCASQAAIFGGVTTVFDMPNNNPPIVDSSSLLKKKEEINRQLDEVDIPLRYHLYLGADKDHFSEIRKCSSLVCGLKIYMGSSTGTLLIDDDQSLDTCFREAAKADLLVAVHAEDECCMRNNLSHYKNESSPAIHSKIRSPEVAQKATEKAISLAAKYKARLIILHMSTAKEVELVRMAKARGLSVYAETSPHHLFLNTKAYDKWGCKVQVNPPIRETRDQEALWKGIKEGVIDTIGTDHAPHTLAEKEQQYGCAPSGIPGIEFLLPLLLNAYNQEKLSLRDIIKLCRKKIELIYRIPSNNDWILVDINKEQNLEDHQLKTKCSWSPYGDMNLKGWPVYTICNGRIFNVERKTKDLVAL